MKKIPFSSKEYQDLLKICMIGFYIAGAVEESRGEDFQKYNKLEDKILSHAKEYGCDHLVRKVSIRGKDMIMLARDFEDEYNEIIKEYENDNFWQDLITRLGKRDFYENMTEEENKEAEKNNWLPERVHDFYKSYEDEFSENGLENLRLKKKIPFN